MRRGINLRKKKRIKLNEANKKSLKILFSLLIIIILSISIFISFIQDIIIKNRLEEDLVNFSIFNEQSPFSLNKVILFSSATAKTKSVNQTLSLDISQYCDIGIYLNNEDTENTLINSLYINDIAISSPELGTPSLYKKRINDLGKCSFSDEAIIENEFSFNIIENDSKEVNCDNYELLNNGTTPISLGFYNKNIKENFITDSTEISYNGTLFKKALIPQISLNCSISFNINIITTEDKHYVCNVSFDIPFEDEDGSIYDTGYATKELKRNELNKFIRIK